jgi:hypothetical protein
VKIAIAAIVCLVVGSASGFFVGLKHSEERFGKQSLDSVRSDSEHQLRVYEAIQRLRSSGDEAGLTKYLEAQIEMARLALRASILAEGGLKPDPHQ